MKIGSKTLGPVILGVFVAGLVLSMAFNLWRTESSKVPARYLSGEYAGQVNPADIRGSYTLGDVSANFAISADLLIKAFALPADTDPSAFKVNEFEALFGTSVDGGEIGTDSLRLFVALYLGLPYVPDAATLIPAPAVALLKDKLATADYESLKELSINPGAQKLAEGAGQSGIETPTPATDSAEKNARVVKGNTTFYDLLDWGLTKQEIEGILGMDMGASAEVLRDFLAAKGQEFSAYKYALQELIDARE